MKIEMELKTNELAVISDDGEIVTIYEFKHHPDPDENSTQSILPSRQYTPPRYETADGEPVLRLSEKSFRILEDSKIAKIFYLS